MQISEIFFIVFVPTGRIRILKMLKNTSNKKKGYFDVKETIPKIHSEAVIIKNSRARA